MKVLFFTPSFYPNIGGLENIAKLLAKELAARGHHIVLITFTPLAHEQELEDGYKIIRKPSFLTFLKEFLKSDIFFHHNVSLKGFWPLLFFPKKWVILHHITYHNFNDKLTPLEWLKRNLSRLGNNVSVSDFVNKSLPKKGQVIYNTYDSNVFYRKPEIKKEKKFLFVGRLVSDKGCILLIEAFYKYLKKGNEAALSIVGNGPELPFLKRLAETYQLSNHVIFFGNKTGEALSEIYNQHQILIIPSIWKEPFGIVALEGLACGCKIICSDGDGLKEASLGFATLFKKGNIDSLVNAMLNISVDELENYELVLQRLEVCKRDRIGDKWENYLNKIYEN